MAGCYSGLRFKGSFASLVWIVPLAFFLYTLTTFNISVMQDPWYASTIFSEMDADRRNAGIKCSTPVRFIPPWHTLWVLGAAPRAAVLQ